MLRPLFLRPWFRTARPNDLFGRAADLAAYALLALMVLVCLLGQLPHGWVVAAAGYTALVRAVLLLAILPLWGWLRAAGHAMLPHTPYLLGRTLTLREHGERVRIKARDIIGVDVELRQPGMREVFVIELVDGTRHDVCPTDWPGAGQLYRRLARLSGDRPRAPSSSLPGF